LSVAGPLINCCSAFYASVEIRDNPALKGLPIAVGDASMISTSSYEARKFGVRSAMPGFIGKQLCPELLFVKPRYDKYREASKLTRDVFMIYDEEFEAYSLDEAALDLTGSVFWVFFFCWSKKS
jgi:nucleotidyltransferase/DNA polymerase involved in DNA repair